MDRTAHSTKDCTTKKKIPRTEKSNNNEYRLGPTPNSIKILCRAAGRVSGRFCIAIMHYCGGWVAAPGAPESGPLLPAMVCSKTNIIRWDFEPNRHLKKRNYCNALRSIGWKDIFEVSTNKLMIMLVRRIRNESSGTCSNAKRRVYSAYQKV